MRSHQYRVTLEHIAPSKPGEPVHETPLSFAATNHDDLFAIIERIQGKQAFDADTSASLALGLKLLCEVMLLNRDHPLFEDIKGPYRDFIGKIKAL